MSKLSDFLGTNMDMNPDPPDYTQPGQDAYTKKSIQDKYDEAKNTSGSDFAKRAMTGVADDPSAMTHTAQGMQNENTSKGGFGFDGMASAIQSKANRQYDASLGELGRRAEFQGTVEKMNKLNTATRLSVASVNLQRGIDTRINQYQNQVEASRGQMISSILGGAGSAAGMMSANNGGNNNSQNQQPLGVDPMNSKYGGYDASGGPNWMRS